MKADYSLKTKYLLKNGLFLKGFENKIKKKIFGRIYLNLDSDYKNSIMLCGTARSGTNWIADLINYKNEYRYIHEPFNPKENEILKNFEYKQYLNEKNKLQKYLNPAKKIFCGNFRNKWTDKANKKFICKKRLIKDVRAHFMLKWIKANFPEIPIILLLRHPFAVANSTKKLWNLNLNTFLRRKYLMKDFLSPFKKTIERTKDDFLKDVLSWCIENYVPLRQFKENEIHLAFYENFCTKPKEEIKRLFLFLNKKIDKDIYKKLKLPSFSAVNESAIFTGKNKIETWKESVSKTQLKKGMQILRKFGLDKIYSEKPMPNLKNAYKMLAKN